MSDELQIFNNKKPNKIYISPRFTNKNPLTGEDVHSRKISKVFDVKDAHFFTYLKKEKHVVLYVTDSAREEVVLSVQENENRIVGFTIQRWMKKSGNPKGESFYFEKDSFQKMMDFLRSIKFIDFDSKSHFQIKDEDFEEKMKNINSLAQKLTDLSEEEIQELVSNEQIKGRDFVNLAFRKDGLKVFGEKIQNDVSEEREWQEFFQKHDWIFGYGLDYRFMTIFDREMSVGDGGTQDQNKPKTDFLAEFNDFTVLVEIKTPSTQLFDNSKNRAGCWQLSRDFIDAYSQALEQKAKWTLKGNGTQNMSKDGNKILKARTRDPKIILVIGNKKREILDIENYTEKELKQDTFELFRRDSRNIEIITFDELFQRAEFIVNKNIK